jgi:hypothetical protein
MIGAKQLYAAMSAASPPRIIEWCGPTETFSGKKECVP